MLRITLSPIYSPCWPREGAKPRRSYSGAHLVPTWWVSTLLDVQTLCWPPVLSVNSFSQIFIHLQIETNLLVLTGSHWPPWPDNLVIWWPFLLLFPMGTVHTAGIWHLSPCAHVGTCYRSIYLSFSANFHFPLNTQRKFCHSHPHNTSGLWMSWGYKRRCTGKTPRDGMGRELGGGFRMGNTCKSMADSCQCMAKTTTIL